MSNSRTKKECLERKLFGLPAGFSNFVLHVKKGMPLFLFEFELRLLYGVFRATSDGKLNIEPKAFRSSGKHLPSQVRFTTVSDCSPLAEHEFKDVIRSNYYSWNKFYFGLNEKQVNKLMKLFRSKSIFKYNPMKNILRYHGDDKPPVGGERFGERGAGDFADEVKEIGEYDGDDNPAEGGERGAGDFCYDKPLDLKKSHVDEIYMPDIQLSPPCFDKGSSFIPIDSNLPFYPSAQNSTTSKSSNSGGSIQSLDDRDPQRSVYPEFICRKLSSFGAASCAREVVPTGKNEWFSKEHEDKYANGTSNKSGIDDYESLDANLEGDAEGATEEVESELLLQETRIMDFKRPGKGMDDVLVCATSDAGLLEYGGFMGKPARKRRKLVRPAFFQGNVTTDVVGVPEHANILADVAVEYSEKVDGGNLTKITTESSEKVNASIKQIDLNMLPTSDESSSSKDDDNSTKALFAGPESFTVNKLSSFHEKPLCKNETNFAKMDASVKHEKASNAEWQQQGNQGDGKAENCLVPDVFMKGPGRTPVTSSKDKKMMCGWIDW